MTYASNALGISGLVAGWKLTDAAGGTTAADVGPNSLPLTYSAAKIDGAESINSFGASASFTGAYIANRASAAVLELTTGMSLIATATINALPASSFYLVAGKNSNYQLRINSNGAATFALWTTGGTITLSSIAGLMTVGKTYFLAATYDGKTAKLYVNGKRVARQVVVGTISATSSNFEIGGTAGVGSALYSGVYLYNSALTFNQIRSLYIDGTKTTPVTDSITLSNLYDSTAVIAAASLLGYCNNCGGSMRTNERRITDAAGDFYHDGCYGIYGNVGSISAISSSSTQRDYATMTQQLMLSMFQRNTQQVTDGTKSCYFDGTVLQPTAQLSAIEIQLAFFASLGVLRRMGGVPAGHWSVTAASNAIDKLITYQNATGAYWDPVANASPTDFIIAQLAELIIYLRDVVPAAKTKAWTASVVKAGNWMIAPSSGTAEAVWYINGNREAQEMAGYWWLYRLTGDSKWLTRYNTQYDFMMSPVGGQSQYPAPATDHYGFVTVVTPTAADGSDGAGYLQERDPSKNPPTYNITGYDGYDPNYVMLCNAFLSRLWLANGDARLLKLINMQTNMLTTVLSSRLNRSTWQVDGTGGSRQNNSAPIVPAPCFAAVWKGGSSAFSASDLAGIWNATEAYYRGNMEQPAPGIYRGLNLDLGTILIASSAWPGIPS